MPRLRNSRSASPIKPLSSENIEIERRKIVQKVQDIFQDSIDIDVIKLVLQECDWKEVEAVDKLLTISESHEEQSRYKSKLHRIAEGVFGSLRSEDYGSQNAVPASSNLSQSQKVIRRPQKQAKPADRAEDSKSRSPNVGSSEQLLAKGLAPKFYLGAQGKGNSMVDEIEMDLHFPQLTKHPVDNNFSSPASSVSSQKSHNENVKPPSSTKSALLSQAQSAFNQQFDDAEGTQRWEQYKQKLSDHYLNNLTKDKDTAPGKSYPAVSQMNPEVIPEDPAILQAELESPRSDNVTKAEVERPRSEASRNFPVRLLSRSPDTVEVDGNAVKNETDPGTLDSADLDETVLKCIYEVQGDLLDYKELERSSLSQNAELKSSVSQNDAGTGRSTQLSNEAMTLPTIGLSVDAQEFVPRPKPAATTKVAVKKAPIEPTDSTPQPASKMTKSSSIEIKSGVKNAHINSPSPSVGSPLTISPSLSPAISPPTTIMSSPVTNLTGSPMFITPKWPPVLHSMNHPPPPLAPTVLASTTSRYTTQSHLPPQGFRFPPGVPLPYSSRMIYTVAPPPPMFRMAGVQQFVQPSNVHLGDHMEERAAIATGQPIMATSEASRFMSLPGLATVKLINQSYIEEKVEKVHTLQNTGHKVLVIVRGLPGSGKSTLARAVQMKGIVLSTDDYFMKGNMYEYNPDKLTEAHQWNRERAKEAMRAGKSPIIIDNTNTQLWEFKPYANLALTFNYHIEMMEPNTPWKYKTSELARRTLHGVPKDQIERMSYRFEHNITVELLIRKRKADNRSSDGDVSTTTNEVNNSLEKSNETLTSPDESSQTNNQKVEGGSSKDLKLQNIPLIPDHKKQKSVESDSDSISSFQSDSLSNQSSRNASPKPLRPSLKTPGALQKMEKLKSPVTKPTSVKATVKKVKRKAIKQMELKLSADTVEIVNDMVNEHVGERILSVEDVSKLEEELQALLIIYPVNEAEISLAEELIALKLQDCINQSAEIPEDEDNGEVDEVENESSEILQENDKNDNRNIEQPINDISENTEAREENSKLESIESVDKGCLESYDKQLIDNQNELNIKIMDDVLSSEIPEDGGKTVADDSNSNKKRHFPTWTNIAASEVKQLENMNNSNRNQKSNNDITDAQDLESDNRVDESFELQYWGKEKKNFDVTTVVHEVETTWEGIVEDFGGESNSVEKFEDDQSAKPQRQRKNRSGDALSDVNSSQSNDSLESCDAGSSVVEKANICDEIPVGEDGKLADTEKSKVDVVKMTSENFDPQSTIVDLIKEGSDNTKTADDHSSCSSNVNAENSSADILAENSSADKQTNIPNVDAQPVVSNADVQAEVSNADAQVVASNADVQVNVSNADAQPVVSNADDAKHLIISNCSNTETLRSQDCDQETSKLNNSLQMLKESYTDSAIHSDNTDLSEDIDSGDKVKLKEALQGHENFNGTKTSQSENNNHNIEDSFEEEAILNGGEILDDGINSENKVIEKAVELQVESTKSNIKPVNCTESSMENSKSDNSVKNGSGQKMITQGPPQISSPVSGQGNKKPRRKMAANLHAPFLNNEDKEKFKTSSWNSFPLHSSGKSVISNVNNDSDLTNGKDLNHAVTMTEAEYFNLSVQLNHGGFVDSSIRYLIGNPKKLVIGGDVNEPQKAIGNKVNHIVTIDKSTSTDDLEPLTDVESVEFLRTCFPSVSTGELECVLENCDNNTEWAINLLLDWKYSLHLSPEEKKQFAEGIVELKRASPTLDREGSTQSDRLPSSLLDICFSLVEREKIAPRDEIEKQLIQSGKERLDRIEDENITKIRLHRTTSLSESSFETGRTSPLDLSVFCRSVSSPAKADRQTLIEDNSSLLDIIGNSKIQVEQDLDIDNRRRNEMKDSELTESTNDKGNEILDGSNDIGSASVNHVDINEEMLAIKPAVMINVDTEAIGQLEEMFGPLSNRSEEKDSVSVPLDRKTAWLLYQCLKKGIVLKREQEKKERQQLVEDEEFARQLQEQENAARKSGTKIIRRDVPTNSRARRGTPLVGLSVQGIIPEHKEPVAWNRGNQSLAEIMQEEQRIQDRENEFKKLIENEGGNTAMASCLKRQKLYGRFPTLDRSYLDEILQTHCYNLTEATAAISISIQELPASDTMGVDSAESEDRLIEETKQQSMQEMLDSYIYHSVSSKDYQDGTEPEYEDYRGEANLHFRLRHECFQKAREAYRRGLKEVANFYSQQGHKHTEKIKEANTRASNQILAERNLDLESNKVLDLHGLHVDEAIEALNRIIPQKEIERCKKLTVITGRGSHSRGGIARLRPSVITYFKAKQYSYSEVQSGVFNVSLKYRTPDR